MTAKERKRLYWEQEAEKQLQTMKAAPTRSDFEREKKRYVEIRKILDEIDKTGI